MKRPARGSTPTLPARLVALLLALAIVAVPRGPAAARLASFQQAAAADVASYAISVALDPDRRQLRGQETITYTNTTSAPIPDLVFHLYLNAFASADTLFMRESGSAGHDNSFDPVHNGWIEVSGLRLQDGPALRLAPLEDGTLARAALPHPVAPGEQVVVELSFRAQLPRVIARTGWALDADGQPFFMAGQWFPKLGVWTETGWNAYPFHANNEFFSNFGDYSVEITAPEDYIVVATGIETRTASQPGPPGQSVWRFSAHDVIDFAWAASPNFQSASRKARGVELTYVYLPEHAWSVQTALEAAENAFTSFSDWFGPYPYPRLTILDVPEDGVSAGGMEYPMLVTAGAGPTPESGGFMGGGAAGLEMLITHEVGHQWWQSVVAFNEAEEPWLDEGLTDYATTRLMLQEYGVDPRSLAAGRYGNAYLDRRRTTFLRNPDIPMYGQAWELRSSDYVIAAYAKPALSLLTLEAVIGSEEMLDILSAFFERYRFAHPTTADLRRLAEAETHHDLGWFFDGLVFGEATLDYVAREISAGSITLAREGGLAAPVPVEVTFSDGTRETLVWDADPAEEILRFAGRPEVQAFRIDPQHTRYIELDWRNNRLERAAEPAPPSPVAGPPQEADARDVASYTIAVSLDSDLRRLHGQETITYTNTTTAPIPDLIFHLYLNAFASEETFFLRESGGMRGFDTWDPQNPGWITVESLRADGNPLELALLEDGTLARAILPQPVAPGQSIELEVKFTAQLPRIFARTGWAPDARGEPYFMVGQWFPKLGVWTEKGWNAYPFHANSEFFADFGDYEVEIDVPKGYVVAATGIELDNDPTHPKVRFQAKDVIDFAWAASPNFRTATRRVGATELVYYYLPEHAWTVKRVLAAAETALRYFSNWYGDYPYPRFTLVDAPAAGQGAGGMEYPTLVTVGAADLSGIGFDLFERLGMTRGLELVTIHETGHQWWQSLVAFNEAEEPWLDEGLTDYSTLRAMNAAYGERNSAADLGGFELGYLDLRRAEFLLLPDVPMSGKAWDYSLLDYGIAAYSKPALALLTLERSLGEETMDTLMQEFFHRYRFAHPTTADFRRVAVEVSGQDLGWFFDGLVDGSATLNYAAQEISEKSFSVTRQGDLAIPTEILVTFTDGSQQRVAWDGQPAERTFTFAQPLESFIIDPERALLVELTWSDNGLARQANWQAWLAAAARLVYRLQDWLLIAGGI